jgi:hypothetical protein
MRHNDPELTGTVGHDSLSLVLIHRKLSPTIGDAYRRWSPIANARNTSKVLIHRRSSQMTADVFRNFPPRHKMASFYVKFMISVKLQLIISLLVEEKTTFTHFS